MPKQNGGARPNAGGARPGAGRKKGSRNKITQESIDQAKKYGITPLEYLMKIMTDESQPDDVRIECAKAAAPYVHPKLSAVQVDANLSISHEDALAALK